MHAQDDRDRFSPPRPPGRLRAIALAVAVHAVLITALTWGVNWKTSEQDKPAVQAELWSTVAQQAAQRAIEPPLPAPEPARPTPASPPSPPAPPPVRQAVADTHEADIAIERERERLEQEKKLRQQQIERDKRERERQEEERRERLAQEKRERLQKEKAEQQKAEREKERIDKQKQLAEEKKLQAQQDQRKQDALEKASAKAAEARRQENIRRMQGLAGATGGEGATGTALRDSGPSGTYGGKVATKVRPNIVYPDAIAGNPRAVVQVRAAPDGTIIGKKLVQSSGNKAWDDAVLRALDKTESLPRDVDGRVPSTLEIGFRPQD